MPYFNGFKAKPKNAISELRTSKVLHLVYNFLGIEISDEDLNRLVVKYSFENISKQWTGKGKFVRTASPGKWRENFNENERETMNNIMAPTLHQLGYSI
jgi:hypothetical protein